MAPTKPNKSLTFHHPNTSKPEKKDKPLKQVFRGKEMAISGSFTNAGKAVSVEKTAKWITLHGGVFVSEVGSETTHLICDVEDYKRKRPQVTKARALGKKCKIVTFDWLEECLLRSNKRLAPTSEYTLAATIQRLQKRNLAEARLKRDFANGVLSSESFIGHHGDKDPVTDARKGLHRVYFDQTAFEYKVELRRTDVVGGRTRVERYTLFLFQSIAQPYTYMTAAQLNETTITPNPSSPSNLTSKATKTHRPTSYFREYCAPKEFHHAFADFKHFFHEKTGLEWDDRLEDGLKGRFRYVLPTEGRPLGVLPPGRKRRAVYPVLEREEGGMEWEIVNSGGIEGRSDGLDHEIEEIDRIDTEILLASGELEENQVMNEKKVVDLNTEDENPEDTLEMEDIMELSLGGM
ncbi:hypothetical protein HYALB_00003195 [Hymenoscyphus albidus]|uniref:BRCT domain-containing protein n=1 Tax=Hymenoscyphus albidus TaxID=595503 RepID=A0A9N9LWC2_9HELO|nr:hypothetical protein HYALB_00003195 [Hymenoscyphus albidus]